VNTLLDVGADAGLYSILAARKNAQTYSFEPNPINLQYLQDNICLNNLKNITIISKAVSNQPGVFQLHYSKQETASSSGIWQNGREECVSIESITLDSAASVCGWKNIKILKIDTEGNDLKVLEGATETLKKMQIYNN
jgi:FkbM family methyltransferase